MTKIKLNLLIILSFAISAAIPNPPDLGVGSYVLYEPTTKKVLVSFNADDPVQPASLTKLSPLTDILYVYLIKHATGSVLLLPTHAQLVCKGLSTESVDNAVQNEKNRSSF